jgi:hypothetical protein
VQESRTLSNSTSTFTPARKTLYPTYITISLRGKGISSWRRMICRMVTSSMPSSTVRDSESEDRTKAARKRQGHCCLSYILRHLF